MRSVDCQAQARSAVGETPLPRSEQRCVYEGDGCLATTHTCNAEGCLLLVCDSCASNMCPEGGNENEYHFCPAHCLLPAPEEDEKEDRKECASDSDDEPDPFAFVPTGRSKTL